MTAKWNIDIPMPTTLVRAGLRRLNTHRLPFPWLFWTVAGAAILALVGVPMAMVTGATFIGIVSAVLFLMILIVTANGERRARLRTARNILTYVQQAIEMNLPIPQLLTAAADGETKRMRASLAKLKELLDRGEPLSLALGESTADLSPRVLGLIAAAERNGDLGGALQRILDEPTSDDRGGLWRDFGLFRTYALVLLITFGIVTTLIELFDYPMYRQVLKDIHMPLPPSAQWLDDWGVPIGLVVSCAGLLVAVVLAGRALKQLSTPSPWFTSRSSFADRLCWHFPLLGSIFRNRDHGDVFEVLAASLDRGEPLNQAVDDALLLSVNAVFHKRLQRCQAALQSGQPIGDALAFAGFPPLVIGLCSAAARAKDLPSTMHFLARYYRWQLSRTLVILRAAAAPLTATVGGACVLLAWSCLYSPMLVLINSNAIVRRTWW